MPEENEGRPGRQVVDDDGIVAWVAEHEDLDPGDVAVVLRIEFEYMVATGIATGPDIEFRYYQPGALGGAPRSVDTLRLAQDAQRLACVPIEIGLRVLDGELAFLETRGLA